MKVFLECIRFSKKIILALWVILSNALKYNVKKLNLGI